MMLEEQTMVIVADCFACGQMVAACPECAVVIKIDPRDGLPLDVALVDGCAVPKPIDPEAVARAIQCVLCDDCVDRRNARAATPIMNATERHKRFHAVS